MSWWCNHKLHKAIITTILTQFKHIFVVEQPHCDSELEQFDREWVAERRDALVWYLG